MSEQIVLIKLEQLSKTYQLSADQVQPVLHGIDLQINQGEFIAIMGPSGSGKSTLMNILGCLDQPSAGNYYLNQRNVSQLDSNYLAKIRNQEIGFVFQGFNLLMRRSIADNVAMPMIYHGTPKIEVQRRVAEQLEKVGLKDYGSRLPTQLSGGQQQRVAIARALVNRPKLLLADEPTGNLDSKTSIDIMSLFVELNEVLNVTIVLVTHEQDIAEYAKRLIKIRDGNIAFDNRNCMRKEKEEVIAT